MQSVIKTKLSGTFLYSEHHFSELKKILSNGKNYDYVVTDICINMDNVDGVKLRKITKLKKEEKFPSYIYVNIVTKIDNSVGNIDLKINAVFLSIHDYVKHFLKLH